LTPAPDIGTRNIVGLLFVLGASVIYLSLDLNERPAVKQCIAVILLVVLYFKIPAGASFEQCTVVTKTIKSTNQNPNMPERNKFETTYTQIETCTKYVLTAKSSNSIEGSSLINKYLSESFVAAVTKFLSSRHDNWEPAAKDLGEIVIELIKSSERDEGDV